MAYSLRPSTVGIWSNKEIEWTNLKELKAILGGFIVKVVKV